jgi:RNA polymerase sigma factor (sigma-70 family)
VTTTEKEPRTRRHVTDEEYRLAYEGDPRDPASQASAADNRNVIAAVLKTYELKLPEDSRQDCGLIALWRALQYHDPKYRQKFTTSLHRFVHWECKRELRRIYGRNNSKAGRIFVPLFEETLDLRRPPVDEQRQQNLEHVRECLDRLPEPSQRRVIEQYYFDGLTMEAVGRANGYSKEAARQKIRRAVAALKEICLAGV